MRTLRLIESDHRNLKKVTDTGVGTGDKEESLVRIPYFNIGSVRFLLRSPAAVFSYLKFAVAPEGCYFLHTVEPVSGQELLARVQVPNTKFNISDMKLMYFRGSPVR